MTKRGRGRPQPYLDESGRPLAGSIAEKLRIEVDGIDQGVFIKSRRAGSPVLLYLHGGMPDYFLTRRCPTGLDEDFTVVWWEQRGSGLSYGADVPAESVNPEQLVCDTLEVTDYLRGRFGQEKIYLMGHSGGTFIGIQAVARRPQLYHAYVAVAQMSQQLESERRAHAFMLRRAREEGRERLARALERAAPGDAVPLSDAYMSLRDKAMHRLGVGTTRDMRSIVGGLLLPSLLFPEYTLREKFGLWRGKVLTGRRLWNEQLATDLTTKVPRVEVPVYLLHGVHDHTVSYDLARSYFERLDARTKGFYTFRRSAHSPLFEEPEKTCAIMREDVLHGTTRLAD